MIINFSKENLDLNIWNRKYIITFIKTSLLKLKKNETLDQNYFKLIIFK
jgi:hypothetical protein